MTRVITFVEYFASQTSQTLADSENTLCWNVLTSFKLNILAGELKKDVCDSSTCMIELYYSNMKEEERTCSTVCAYEKANLTVDRLTEGFLNALKKCKKKKKKGLQHEDSHFNLC